jgi:hypothetical protein
VIPSILLASAAAALIPDIVVESTDLEREGPAGNACSIDFGSGDVDAYWTSSLNDGSEGSVSDPDEGAVGDDLDISRGRVCNNATMLFLWGQRRAASLGFPNGAHFYLDTTGDMREDFDLVITFPFGPVELYSNSSGWVLEPTTAGTRFELSSDGLSVELGIERAYLGLPTAVEYFITTEPDSTPGGPHDDRGPDSGYSGTYTVPAAPTLLAFAVAAAAPILLLARSRPPSRPTRSARVGVL